ncbi:MAG: T9SS type A sorting domain-containing protein [Chitinophagales bacterium]|nr:T9SS type A sorting domain-containing protein [Chitinophagales bacterium]
MLLLQANYLLAQNFSKTFVLDSQAVVTTAINVIDNNIYVTGYTNDSTFNSLKTFVAKFDANGNLIQYKYYRKSGIMQFVPQGNSELIWKKNIYLTGYLIDTNSNSNYRPPFHVFLLKVDTNLNGTLLFDAKDTAVQIYSGYCLTMDATKNFYIAGVTQKELKTIYEHHPTHPFIIKTDSNGNFVHKTIDSLFDRSNIYTNSILFHNNKLYLTVSGDSNLNITDPIYHIHTINYIYELDTACNLVTTHNYSDSNAYASQSTIFFNNRFYGCGKHIINRFSYPNGSGNAYLKPSFYKFNSNYQRLYKQTYADTTEYFGLNKIKQVPNQGNLLMVGERHVNSKDTSISGFYGFLVKTDTLGNTTWERNYIGSHPIPNFLTTDEFDDFDYLSDGSIIVLGNIFIQKVAPNFISQQGWLLRLSPDGCLSPNDCGVETGLFDPPTASNTQALNILLYPNPSSDELSIKIKDNQIGFPIQFTVYDLVGKQISTYELTQSQQTINISKLLPGQYFAMFSKNGKRLSLQKFEHF